MAFLELTQDVQFTVDQSGQVTAVVIAPTLWRQIIETLEDATDLSLVKRLLPRLSLGPVPAGALRWQDVVDEW